MNQTVDFGIWGYLLYFPLVWCIVCDPGPGRITVILTITPQDANLQYEQSGGRKKEILISNGLEVAEVALDL